MSSNPTRIISTSPAELQNQRVATRDLDPDPSNGLKNENQQRNQGSVRQEPIRVPMQQNDPSFLEQVTGVQVAPDDLEAGPPAVFDPRIGARILSGETTTTDILQRAGIDAQQPTGVMEDLGDRPSLPLVGPPGVGVAAASRQFGRLRNIPGQIRSRLPSSSQVRNIFRGPQGQRGQLQLTEPLGQVQQRARTIIRGEDIAGRGGPPQRFNPAEREIVGSGGGGVGAQRMQIARQLDEALQRQAVQRRLQAQEQAAESIRLFGQAQRPQAAGGVVGQGQLPELGFPQTQGLPFTESPQLGFQENLGVPQAGSGVAQGFQQQLQRPGFDQFGQLGVGFQPTGQLQPQPQVQTQFPTQGFDLAQRGRQITPSVTSMVGQGTGVTTTPFQTQTPTTRLTGGLPFFVPQIPRITTTTRTPRINVPPTPTPRIPGGIPFPPLAGGGGGAPRAGDRRRFPFGQVREFSPAFPGTSFRVLPDGTVVLDVDPGQREQSNRVQPRDPETGQFISAVS